MHVTPAHRFAANAAAHAPGAPFAVTAAWRHASQWESFPHSYTADQVAAGQEFITAFGGDHGPTARAYAVARVVSITAANEADRETLRSAIAAWNMVGFLCGLVG